MCFVHGIMFVLNFKYGGIGLVCKFFRQRCCILDLLGFTLRNNRTYRGFYSKDSVAILVNWNGLHFN